MKDKWDLLVLNPILLVLGIGILSFILIRERTSLKWVLYFVSTLIFWFVTALVVGMNAMQLQNAALKAIFSNPVWIMLLFLGSATLFSIFLKPLATWITGKLHWRKWWILLGFLGLSIAFVLTIVNQAMNLVTFYIFIAITLAVSLSSNSLFFLSFNEQFYYRIAPVLSSVLISVIISFATFSGTYFVNLEANLFPTGSNSFLVMCILFGFIGLIIFGILLAFFSDEDKTYVRSFELDQLKQLPKYHTYRLIYLVIAVFFLGAFFGLTQSTLVLDYLRSLFYVNNVGTWLEIDPYIRSFNQFFIIPQFLLGYGIYRQVSLKFGFKPVLLALLALSLLAIMLIAYLDNPFIYVFFNFVLGLTFSQLFYAFFAMAMMWNYRSKNIPVTGIVSAAGIGGSFLVELVIQLVKANSAGIYQTPVLEEPTKFQQSANLVVIVIYGVVGAFCILNMVTLFFSMKIVFADYLSITAANQNAKVMLQDQQRQKSRNRILVKEVKISE